MARKALIEKEKKRLKLKLRYEDRRKQYKAIIKSFFASEEEKDFALKKMSKLPRNSSPVRLRNRCQLTGRPRAVYRKFRLSRLCFREMALEGLIPGVVKSSW